MKTLEQLDAEHKAKREKLEREIAIATAMPVPPKRVHDFYPRISLVTYEVPTLGEAVDIMQKFEIVPMHVGRGTFSEVAPLATIKPENQTRVQGPYVCFLKVHTRDNDTADADLIFYAASVETIRVVIKFGKDYIGHCDALRSPRQWQNSSGGRSKTKQWFLPNSAVPYDHLIDWSTAEGPVKTYSEMYYMLADRAAERLTELAQKLDI